MRSVRKKRIIRSLSVSLVLAMLFGMLPVCQQTVMASVWDNAYSYFRSYENDVVFRPTSNTDGEIYCATKAAKASTNTRYRTIGWKVRIQNRSGSTLQTLYFKLGGSYMYKTDVTTKSNYEYNLYVLPLGNLKRRMNDAALNAMNKGNLSIVFDACMVVVKNGRAKGAMNDSGPTSGSVYTTYSGISNAASWSASARQSFYNYFDKPVQGLFFTLQVRKETGIASVSGGGEYCFGTNVVLKAKTESGYEFDRWEGPERYGFPEISTCVNGNQRWNAVARAKELTIVFHRNKSSGDTVTAYQKVAYGNENMHFQNTGWNEKNDMLGWALAAGAKEKDYSVNSIIRGSWIIKHSPQVDLYAVWKEQEPDPTTPDPVTPDPVTPDPVTPDPTTPDPTTPDPTTPDSTQPDPATPDAGEKKLPIRCRFISRKYFEDKNRNLIPEEKGGLAAGSRWATDQLLREKLRQALLL